MRESYMFYPYLWQWSIDDYTEYVATVEAKKNSVFIIAKDNNDEIAGFIFGFPIEYGDDIVFIQDVLKIMKDNYDYENYFYLCEAVVKMDHRNRGLVRHMLSLFYEEVSRKNYQKICAGVVNEFESDLKYSDYKELSTMWNRLGLQKTDLVLHTVWDTIHDREGSSRMMEHDVSVWIKDLEK